MSTATIQPNAGEWKQEVNRRLAAHRERRGLSAQSASQAPPRHRSDNRAAQAAARVAARFAQAPSYEQMQAAEARAALREAQIATQVALEARAKAQAVLANLQQQQSPVESLQAAAAPSLPQPSQTAGPDFWTEPAAAAEPAPRAWSEEPSVFAAPEIDAPAWTAPAESTWESNFAQPLEPVQTLAANLIEFPRQLVATRKVRPRLAEGPLASVESERQLSIFEVDPSSVASATEPLEASPSASRSWAAPEWSGVMLEAQPEPEIELDPEPLAPRAQTQPALDQASLGRRFQAAVVDGSLLVGLLAGALSLMASRLDPVPAVHTLETGSALAISAGFLLYHLFFGLLGLRTPGMVYARLTAASYDGQRALPSQIRLRALTLLLSVLPAGLGLLWAFCDEHHLSWHDRLSSTFLRKA